MFFFVVKRQTTSIVPCQACFVMIYIYVCDLVFLVTLSKRMMKRQYVIKTKKIVSVLTFLRSSQGIVGWGCGGRQMDGGTDK